jgi:uncharacterized protein
VPEHDQTPYPTLRDEYPPGVPCWVDTEQLDPQAGAAFYGDLFGWDFEDRMPADAPGNYLVAKLRGLDVAAVSSQMDASHRPGGTPTLPSRAPTTPRSG